MLIDGGLPASIFLSALSSFGEYIDLVKFGWGTALVTPDLDTKTDALDAAGTGYFFGGTLFEKHVQQGQFDAYRRLCDQHRCRYVEVSNGTIDLPADRKGAYIAKLAADFTVLAEVGFKDERSADLDSRAWIDLIDADLAAGAAYVILESRESGTGGICRPDGRLRTDVVDDILATGVDPDRLVFEAPTKPLQAHFINRLGPDVNLGNIAWSDVASVETLRLGLRSETFFLRTTGGSTPRALGSPPGTE
jgi:phosphosulfolactate synthase